MGRLQQITEGELRMVERQGRHPQALQLKHHKRRDGMAEVEQAGVLEQIVAAGVVRRAIDRDRPAHAPAQRNSLHMIR